MKRKFRVLFFLISGLTLSSSLFAQSNIVFGSNGVQHEDTLYIGDTIHFDFWLVNQGPSVLNDSITVNCETFDFFGSSISSMAIGSSYNTNSSLSVGDSLHVTISEIVTYQSYVLGDNIIVIWPAFIAPGGNVDTSITNIHILGSLTGNASLNNLNNILLVPNPVVENLYFYHTKGLAPSSIFMYNSFGDILFNRHDVNLEEFIFNVGILKKGIYFIEINSRGHKKIKKFIVH